MRRPVRVLVLSLSVLFGAVALAVAVLLLRFDAADAKALIVERVQRETGRTLDLAGDVSLSLWPRLGLAMGPVSLSEAGSREAFASARAVRLSLALRPLLSRRWEIGRVDVDGLQARVVRWPDGRTSIDDLIGSSDGEPGGGGAPAAAFRLDALAIRDAALTLDDRAAGRRIALSGLRLDLGRLAPGVAAPLKLSAQVRAEPPTLALAVRAGGQVVVDPAQGRHRLDALEFGVDGEVAGRPVGVAGGGQVARGPEGLQATLKGRFQHDADDSGFQARVTQDRAPEAPLQVDLDVERLRVAGVRVEQIRAGARIHAGRITLDPLSAALYGGRADGSAGIDLRAAQPRIVLRQTLAGVQVGPLLKDATGVDRVQGRGDLVLQVETRGSDLDALRQGLSGRANVVLRDGALRGINIAQVLRQARGLLGRAPGEGGGAQGESTDFTELSASFSISKGVAHNEDLSAKSPLLRATGRGDVDLGAGRIDYLLQATVVDTLRGQGGPELDALRGKTVPVRLTGTFDAIRWRIDVGAMAKEAARRTIDERKEEVRKTLKKELGEQIKGLFGR